MKWPKDQMVVRVSGPTIQCQGRVVVVLACILLSWILEKSPTVSLGISHCTDPPEPPMLYLMLSFSYSTTFSFPTSLPKSPHSASCVSDHLESLHPCSPLLCFKCPALTPTGSHLSFLPRHLTCAFPSFFPSFLLPSLFIFTFWYLIFPSLC